MEIPPNTLICPASAHVPAGIGNVLGNKGGAALSFTLGEARLLFVCAHFAAHDDKVERRNADYHRIRTGLFSSAATNGSGGTGPSAAQKLLGLKRAGGSVGSGLFQWGSVAADGLVSERSGSWTIGATGGFGNRGLRQSKCQLYACLQQLAVWWH